jgi:hypothetical protein
MNQKKIGLINCKDASEFESCGRGNFYLGQKLLGYSIPAYASLTMLQAVFDVFNQEKHLLLQLLAITKWLLILI